MRIDFQLINSEQNILNRIINDDVKFYANSRLQVYCDPYIPMDTGALAQNVNITKYNVEYTEPYAKRNYYGTNFNFSKDIHPLATSLWDKSAMQTKGDRLVQDVENYIKRS